MSEHKITTIFQNSIQYPPFPPIATPEPHTEYREINKKCNDRKGHPTHGAYSEIEPEHFIRPVEQERDQSENSGNDCQHYRLYLVVECLHELPDIIAPAAVVPHRVHEINPGIHDYAAQHHESRKATLIKRKIRKAEHEKHTYERNWYQQDDSQRVFKRLERHAAHDIDDSSHQKQKPCVFPTLFLTPAPVRRRRSLVPDRQQFFIEIFDSIIYAIVR